MLLESIPIHPLLCLTNFYLVYSILNNLIEINVLQNFRRKCYLRVSCWCLFNSCRYSEDNDNSLFRTDKELECQLCSSSEIEIYLPSLCRKPCATSASNTIKLSQDSASFKLVNTKHFEESKNYARYWS